VIDSVLPMISEPFCPAGLCLDSLHGASPFPEDCTKDSPPSVPNASTRSHWIREFDGVSFFLSLPSHSCFTITPSKKLLDRLLKRAPTTSSQLRSPQLSLLRVHRGHVPRAFSDTLFSWSLSFGSPPIRVRYVKTPVSPHRLPSRSVSSLDNKAPLPQHLSEHAFLTFFPLARIKWWSDFFL